MALITYNGHYVCLCVGPSVYLFVYLFLCLKAHLHVFVSISKSRSIYMSISIFIAMRVCRFICMFVGISIMYVYLFVCSFLTSMCIYVCMSVCISNLNFYLYLCLYVCLYMPVTYKDDWQRNGCNQYVSENTLRRNGEYLLNVYLLKQNEILKLILGHFMKFVSPFHKIIKYLIEKTRVKETIIFFS